MEDKIPQSFKVQWLNTTLKFVKDDNQMVKEYPPMPIAQVEYLHNLIWQRQNNLGLGFKSLYAPLWEAMRIFSVKYQFQVSVTKATTGDLGQLKIQKILKTPNEECNKPPLEPNNQKTKKSTSPVYEKPTIMPQNTKSTNEECTKVVEDKDEKIKVKPKKPSRGQKYLAHARKIIDSIAPSFFKTTFQKIFDFLSDKASASFTFSDLAPNEVKFLQNFVGIYKRRTYFESLFSPYCNDLLDKICIIYKEFDKTCKLDVCVGKTDSKTCKREIIFLKVPKYTKNTTSKAKLSKNPNEQLSSENETDSSSNKFLKALQFTVQSTKDDHNTSIFMSSYDSRTIDNTDIETDDEFDYNATDKDNVKSMVFNNATLKDAKNSTLVNSEKYCDIINKNKMTSAVQAKEIFSTEENSTNDMYVDNEYDLGNERKKLKTIDSRSNNKTNEADNIFVKAIEKVEDKEKVPESKEKDRVLDDSSITVVLNNLKEMKITINNMEKDITKGIREKMRSVYLKDGNTKKTPQVPKTGIVFAKASESTDIEKVADKSTDSKVIQGSRKNKLLEAMSTPLESDKALRMMRLMGWKGGALGLRGEGITEPIIPDLNIKPGAGLGHVSEQSKKKQDKLTNRLQLLEAILDLVTSDDTETIILCNSDITKKEKRFFNEIINLYNMNRTLNLSNKCENELCQKIQESLEEVQHKLDLVHHSNRKLTLKKVVNTESKKGKKKKTEQMELSDFDSESADIVELPTKKTQYKILILTKVLAFQKDKENLVLNVTFDSLLTTKYRTVLEKLCSSVNSRMAVTNKNVPYKHLAAELYENYDDSFYDITYGLDLKSFTIRKVKQKPGANAASKKKNAKTVKKVKETSEKSLTDGDQSVLSPDKTVNAGNKENASNSGTDKNDSKDTNNNGSKEVKLNTGWSEVVSPKKNKPLILLVQLKTKKFQENIANLIVRKINSEVDLLPHLKSHGVQDGYIVYSCYTKSSYLWLKSILTDYRVIDYKGMDDVYVLQIKMNVCMDCKKVLNLLDKYNPSLNSSDWDVLDVNYFDGSIEFLVQLGFNSFEYVRSNHFKLHAGVDEVQFTINIDYYSSYLQVLD